MQFNPQKGNGHAKNYGYRGCQPAQEQPSPKRVLGHRFLEQNNDIPAFLVGNLAPAGNLADFCSGKGIAYDPYHL
jgi:hypothetical protein